MQKIICQSSGSFCMTMIPCYNPCIQAFHPRWRSKINNDEDTPSVSREAATLFPNNSLQHLNSLRNSFHELPLMHLTLHKKIYIYTSIFMPTDQWIQFHSKTIQFIACSISTMCWINLFPTSEEAEKKYQPWSNVCCKEAFDF